MAINGLDPILSTFSSNTNLILAIVEMHAVFQFDESKSQNIAQTQQIESKIAHPFFTIPDPPHSFLYQGEDITISIFLNFPSQIPVFVEGFRTKSKREIIPYARIRDEKRRRDCVRELRKRENPKIYKDTKHLLFREPKKSINRYEFYFAFFYVGAFD